MEVYRLELKNLDTDEGGTFSYREELKRVLLLNAQGMDKLKVKTRNRIQRELKKADHELVLPTEDANFLKQLFSGNLPFTLATDQLEQFLDDIDGMPKRQVEVPKEE